MDRFSLFIRSTEACFSRFTAADRMKAGPPKAVERVRLLLDSLKAGDS
jgi:hypothetical protein